MELEQLKDEVRKHAMLYYEQDSPELSDEAYDALLEELRRRDPDAEELHYLGRPAARSPVRHVSTMGSLVKVRSTRELPGQFKCNACALTPKLDGMSVELRYSEGRLVLAVSRGDGEVGENITDTAAAMQGVPGTIALKGFVRVRGEAVISRSRFAGLKEAGSGLSSPRNAAAGALRALDPSAVVDRGVSFIACDLLGTGIGLGSYSAKLSLLEKLGFASVQVSGVHFHLDEEEFMTALGRVEDERLEGSGPPVDGAVLRIDDETVFAGLGYKNKCPAGAVAWKFEALSRVTRCWDVLWSTGRTGKCIPVGVLEPVELAGAEVSRATLSSRANMQRLGITPGCLVAVRRSGDVIPEITEVLDAPGDPVEPVSKCPSCSEPLASEGAHLVCMCSSCPSRIINRTRNMLKALRIKGLAGRTLEKLFSGGLIGCGAPCDILNISPAIMDMCGIRGRTAENIQEAIHGGDCVPPATALQACGFPGIGRVMAARLVREGVTLEDLLASREAVSGGLRDTVAGIGGFGEARARTFLTALQEDPYGLDILEALVEQGRVVVPDDAGVLSGTTWLATGTLSMSRWDFENMVVREGGVMAGSVTRGLAGLVVGEGPGSKREQAEEKGVKLYTEEEFVAHVAHLKEKGVNDVSD